jgi:hypothetical protein
MTSGSPPGRPPSPGRQRPCRRAGRSPPGPGGAISSLTAAVYRQAPYAGRGQYDTPHARDNIYAQAGGSAAELKLTRRTGGLNGHLGTIAIGVVT